METSGKWSNVYEYEAGAPAERRRECRAARALGEGSARSGYRARARPLRHGAATALALGPAPRPARRQQG